MAGRLLEGGGEQLHLPLHFFLFSFLSPSLSSTRTPLHLATSHSSSKVKHIAESTPSLVDYLLSLTHSVCLPFSENSSLMSSMILTMKR